MTTQEQDVTTSDPSPKSPTVVGIGASAGGLAALKTLFQHVPADSGLVFVVVVHLSPEHKSHLTDLLQPSVKFPVQQVTEDIRLEPNNVYVIPPNANLSAIDTHLRLSKLEEQRSRRAPIDYFFRTLASTHDGHSIGVILTGTGSDGTLGLKEIKARGGLIVVQQPNEAEFDGMPQSAIATGLVDLILPLSEIPEALFRYVRTEPRVPLGDETNETEHSERFLLPKILAILKTRTERDFSRYKSATLLRRISRRMQLNFIEDFNRYIERLRDHPEETYALADDLLITVTSFFRDPDVFEKLEKEVVPKLFEGKDSQDTLRLWSVGCATGEEAYSLAMILLEEASRRDSPAQIQIFASDLHKQSLDSARDGVFAGDIEADVSPERLNRFFQKENGGYRIRKEVRDLVVFAPHNLLGDPPFLRINLVSCRNLLIYLDRSVQRDVIDLFHYALSLGGYLLLGSSETLEAAELFRTEDKKLCIYRKLNVPGPEPRLPVFPFSRMTAQGKPDSRVDSLQRPIPYQDLHQNMLERYAPPSILVGPADQLVHLSEHGGRYLVHPGGQVTSSAVRLVREELRIELQALLKQARDKKEPVDSRPILVRFNGHAIPVVMHLQPSSVNDQEGFVLVIFNERPGPKTAEAPVEPNSSLEAGQESGRIAILESELTIARERLQSMMEEHESSREEMKAANEEMQSSNEELRSTMEELETSKEELQSINEELQTVNQENRHKVEELSQLSSDLQNLLSATQIATLFLDRQLRILRFTPRLSELFSVRISDRGRPISDLTHRLGYGELRLDAEAVLSKLVPIEREIQDDSGTWYLTRILPYRSTEDRIEGVVVTFIDITTQKNAESVLRSSVHDLFTEGAWLRTILDSLNDGIIATDSQGRVAYFNPVAEQWTGWAQSEAVGKLPGEVYNAHTITGEKAEPTQLQRALANADPIERGRFRLKSRHGTTTAVEFAAAPILVKGQIEGAVAILTDIGERLLQEAAQDVERGRLEGEVSKTTSELGHARDELRTVDAELARVQRALSVGELATSIAHEINQPLAGVVTNAEAGIRWLSNEPPSIQDARESLSLIVRDGNRASAVIRRIREFLKKDGQEHQSLDINQVVEDAAALTKSELAKCGISLRCDLAKDIRPVSSDRVQLQQVMVNLILNAVDAMATTEVKNLLIQTENLPKEGIRVSVGDSGIGIGPETLQQIFAPFFTTKHTGMGMGLAICRTIVEGSGGTISAELNDGPGITVWFELPAEISHKGQE